MNARTMKRSIRKANGLALSKGPQKNSRGKVKGPARTYRMAPQPKKASAPECPRCGRTNCPELLDMPGSHVAA